jgi:hypothetical protein
MDMTALIVVMFLGFLIGHNSHIQKYFCQVFSTISFTYFLEAKVDVLHPSR